jgi:hypothetical protein
MLEPSVNIKLVDSLLQIINSLNPAEKQLLEEKILMNDRELSTQSLSLLAEKGGSFDFLCDEPELYTLKDGEPI